MCLSQNNKKQSVIILTINSKVLLNYTTQNEFNKSYRSDHLAYTIKIHTKTEVIITIQNERFAFHKAGPPPVYLAYGKITTIDKNN